MPQEAFLHKMKYSTDDIAIIVALEEEFKCDFDEDDIENMVSFKIMKTTIHKKLSLRN